MGETYLWHIWPARHWPCSATEERHFIEALTALAGDLDADAVRPFERGDLTTVLNALRNGMTVTDLLAVAPGVKPARLVSAYRHLERLRRQAVEAFDALCAQPDRHSAVTHGTVAAALMPVPTYRLVAVADELAPDRRRSERDDVAARVAATLAEVTRHEHDLEFSAFDTDGRVRLGRVLYDPFAGGLWSSAYYLPQRVGTLVPTRVRDLLGEPPE